MDKTSGHSTPQTGLPVAGNSKADLGQDLATSDGTKATLYFNATAEYSLTMKSPTPYKGEAYTLEYRGGLDDGYRLNKSINTVYGPCLVGCKGYWQDDHTFVHMEYAIDAGAIRIARCSFETDKLTLEISNEFSGASTSSGTVIATLEE